MLGPYLESTTAPLVKKLTSHIQEKNIPPVFIKGASWICAIATILFFGLQYIWIGLVFFLLHRLTRIILKDGQNDTQNKDRITLFSSYLIVTGSMMALLWTASSFSIPVSFMFWAIMINLLGTITFRPKIIAIDIFELSLILLAMVAAPTYIPAIALLAGVACLIGCCFSFIQSLKP